jgi:NADH-quinone oxidoreductase subunit N
MLHDLDKVGPELILLVWAGGLLLAGLALRDRDLRWLPFVALAGIGASAIWTGVLMARDQESAAFSGSYSFDNFSIFFTWIFLGVAGLVILASADFVRRLRYQAEFWALLLTATAGMMLLAGARDLILIFVALELTSISQYILAAFMKDDHGSEAGLKYILLGATASAVILYGMAFLFGVAGTTALVSTNGGPSIASFVAQGDPDTRAALIGAIVLLAAGLSFKVALVPFQMWVPDVYQGASTPVAAFLSVGSKAAGFAVVLRIFYQGFGPDTFVGTDWGNVFAALAAVSMVVGNVMALRQSNVKRLLGYSSIAQAGNVAVGVAAVAASSGGISIGASGVTFFLATYVFTNLGAFFSVLALTQMTGSDEIESLAGIGRRAPLPSIALTLCLISLAGIPPTAGFFAKVYIFNAAAQSDLVWLVIVGVLNTAISVYYYLRIVSVMFVSPSVEEPRSISLDPMLGLALSAAALGVFVIGVVPSPLFHAAQRAVTAFS